MRIGQKIIAPTALADAVLITRSALDEFFADGAHGLCIGHEIREGEGNIIALLVCRDCKVYRKVCVLTESGPLSVLKGFK